MSDQDTDSGFFVCLNSYPACRQSVGLHPASAKPLVCLWSDTDANRPIVVSGGCMSDTVKSTVINSLEWPYSVAPEAVVVSFVVEGSPKTKSHRDYEHSLRTLMRQSMHGKEADKVSRFGLRCLFYRDTRQRIDCDNLMKAVSDAANGEVWKDDAQVVEIIGRLFLANENPRSEILIYRIDDPSPRKRCLTCGGEVVTYPSLDGNYCSHECYSKSTRMQVVCKECGESFELPKSLAKHRAGFCSRKCAMAYYGKQRTAERGPSTWKCKDCGGPVSRREYERCRACSMKERMLPTSNYWKLRYSDDDKRNPRVEVEIRNANDIDTKGAL